MTTRMSFRFAAALCAVAGFQVLAFAGQETFEGLNITADNSGYVASIQISNPGTSLNIESEFLISVSPDGAPTNGTITFKDNVKRSMTSGELKLYFEQYGGLAAVWDYNSQHGNAVTFNLGTEKVPTEALGKVSRLILNNGRQFVGRLGKIADVAEGFSLTMDGASDGPVQFYNGVVKEIRQMK